MANCKAHYRYLRVTKANKAVHFTNGLQPKCNYISGSHTEAFSLKAFILQQKHKQTGLPSGKQTGNCANGIYCQLSANYFASQ